MMPVSLFILAAVIALRVAFERTPDVGVDRSNFMPISTQAMIAQLQERIRTSPDDTEAYAQLGWALLQQVRETGDASLYNRAESAFGEALRHDTQYLDALTGMGSLALSRHQFAEAIRWAEQARAINPYRAQIYGIIADGQIELGRYGEAVATLQKMIDTRPDLNSYSRVSYARELHGETAAAIDAMKRAVNAGNPQAEGTWWAHVQLGNLYFNSGDFAQAEAVYKQILQVKPDYVYAQACIARVKAAHGQHADAIALYQGIVERLPMPEFVIALGELYEVSGQTAQAQQQYALVRAIQQLHASAGVDVDLELALFEAEHGSDPARAVAQARAAYSRTAAARPSTPPMRCRGRCITRGTTRRRKSIANGRCASEPVMPSCTTTQA
jgi:tetratricopeptide (TPR) repeat protein